MSIFAIFAIVLTLGYLLYYGAMIASDLATLKKKQGEEAETIDTGDADDETLRTPTSVYEDPETGGFSFSSEVPEDNPLPIIYEADEPIIPDASNQPNEIEGAVLDENRELEEGHDEQLEEEKEEVPEEQTATEENEEAESDAEDDNGLITVEYKEEKEEKKPELYDVSQAFDSSLTQPKFGISKVIEPTASPEVQQKADNVNDALDPITTFGNQHKPLVLENLMRNKELSEKNNLDTRDEVTRQ